MIFVLIINYVLVGSTPLSLEIIITTVGVCLTLFLVGVVLMIILGCIARKKTQKSKSKKLKTQKTPIDNNSFQM